MGSSSLGPAVEWKTKAPARKIPVGPSRNPSLHLSIEGTLLDRPPFLRAFQGSEEEHRKRVTCLGENVAQLAHDIRNPLSSIEWLASLLGQDHHSQEERQALTNNCIQAVRSLDHLVANILVLSTPLQSQCESVDLSGLLDDVELLATYPLRKKQLTIHRRLDAKLSAIKGHGSLLKQALLNLLMNAIQASESGSMIEVNCRQATRHVGELGSRQVEIGLGLRIRDHGCGMSEEERSNMFRPFYSRRKGGTGLGLSIVKQITHIHHGLIDITSQQGKGTTVELFIPQ